MELDRLYHWMIALAVFFWALFVVGVVGEYRGWWSQAGEILISFATVAGVLATVAAFLMGATKTQVKRVAEAVLDGTRKLDMANIKQDAANTKQDVANARLASMDGKLDHIDVKLDKLDRIDVKLDKLEGLDLIQLQLDRQTGVLDRQVALLVQIRDRIPG